MKVLITGITGMIGTHFAVACKARGWDTYGISRHTSAGRLYGQASANLFHIDIVDYLALEAIFMRIKFDVVIHLAAQAYNALSWEQENYTHQANYQGTLNVLQCVRRHCPEARVMLACSSAEYGNLENDLNPLSEERPLRPISPYGVSKVVTESLGYQYYANYGTRVLLPRLFIHVGTGHPPATAIQNFARQLALIAAGKEPPVLRVGNLASARDFVDVRDGVAGMLLLLDKNVIGQPVNICTGIAYKISDVLKLLIEISGLEVEVITDESLFRPSDEPLLLGDNTRLTSLGWSSEYTLPDTLREVYADWRRRAAVTSA